MSSSVRARRARRIVLTFLVITKMLRPLRGNTLRFRASEQRRRDAHAQGRAPSDDERVLPQAVAREPLVGLRVRVRRRPELVVPRDEEDLLELGLELPEARLERLHARRDVPGDDERGPGRVRGEGPDPRHVRGHVRVDVAHGEHAPPRAVAGRRAGGGVREPEVCRGGSGGGSGYQIVVSSRGRGRGKRPRGVLDRAGEEGDVRRARRERGGVGAWGRVRHRRLANGRARVRRVAAPRSIPRRRRTAERRATVSRHDGRGARGRTREPRATDAARGAGGASARGGEEERVVARNRRRARSVTRTARGNGGRGPRRARVAAGRFARPFSRSARRVFGDFE